MIIYYCIMGAFWENAQAASPGLGIWVDTLQWLRRDDTPLLWQLVLIGNDIDLVFGITRI